MADQKFKLPCNTARAQNCRLQLTVYGGFGGLRYWPDGNNDLKKLFNRADCYRDFTCCRLLKSLAPI